MVFSPGGVFGGTLGGLQGDLGALLCLLGPQGRSPGASKGSLQGLWEPLEPPGSLTRSLWESAKTNSEEGSARAFIFMVSLHHLCTHLLETEYVR